MSTFLLVVGIVAAYLVIGALYARTQAVPQWRKADAEWYGTSSKRTSFNARMTHRVLFWPLVAPVDAIRGPLSTWFFAPVTGRRERAEKLRADAEFWREQADEATDRQVRTQYLELAQMLREQAREVDL